MTWRAFLPSFRRPAPSNSTPSYSSLVTEVQLRNAPPHVIPTTGRLVSNVNRDYFVLTFDPRYASLGWDVSAVVLDEDDAGQQWAADLLQAPLPLKVTGPLSEPPHLGDFHLANTPVVSQTVVDLLRPFQIPGVDFFPARIRLPDGRCDNSYSILYVDQEIQCLDEGACQFQTEPGRDRVLLDRISLDGQRLEAIDLPQRLAFRLQETGREYLFHAALVETLGQQPLRGACFIPVQDWRLDAAAQMFPSESGITRIGSDYLRH